jgi:alkylated DNA repair dioxygenase AlkB
VLAFSQANPISTLHLLSQKGSSAAAGQLDLFAAASAAPDGLRYREEFITAADEAELIRRVRELPLQPFQFGAFEGKRHVASFSFRYDYTERRLQEAEPIPPWLADAVARVETFGAVGVRIGQVLCTEYATGVGIGWHRDKPHFGTVFGLSLGSSCAFRFRRAAGEKWQRFTLEATPRSLYVMADASRHQWEHSIPPVAAPRYSITFRTMAVLLAEGN